MGILINVFLYGYSKTAVDKDNFLNLPPLGCFGLFAHLVNPLVERTIAR